MKKIETLRVLAREVLHETSNRLPSKDDIATIAKAMSKALSTEGNAHWSLKHVAHNSFQASVTFRVTWKGKYDGVEVNVDQDMVFHSQIDDKVNLKPPFAPKHPSSVIKLGSFTTVDAAIRLLVPKIKETALVSLDWSKEWLAGLKKK
jgi:hypothetical protein